MTALKKEKKEKIVKRDNLSRLGDVFKMADWRSSRIGSSMSNGKEEVFLIINTKYKVNNLFYHYFYTMV